MKSRDDVLAAVGDLDRFGALQARVEGLVDDQVDDWISGRATWLLLPIDRQPSGFYLASQSREGQRRGREVLDGFLGPAVASIEALDLGAGHSEGKSSSTDGFQQVSFIRRVTDSPSDFIGRLEDAVATLKGRGIQNRTAIPTHVDMLRDFRLSLLDGDSRSAERLLDGLRLSSQLSSENLRFLHIELLARFERWHDLQSLPYFKELLKARRPRAITELILVMIWRVEIADEIALGQSAREVYESKQIMLTYGSVLSSILVPSTEIGRALCLVASELDGDGPRIESILDGCAGASERTRLESLIGRLPMERSAPPSEVPKGTPTEDQEEQKDSEPARPGLSRDAVVAASERDDFDAVVGAYLSHPSSEHADLAVDAILELQDTARAASIRDLVRAYLEAGQLTPTRRLSRDLDELDRLVDGTCNSWAEWSGRIGTEERWSRASHVLRNQGPEWPVLSNLDPTECQAVEDGLLATIGGVNEDQLLAVLDILCVAAADAVAESKALGVSEAVLLILAEQDSVSDPVRQAYRGLLESRLNAGLSQRQYRDAITQTSALWRRIASPNSVDWGIGVADLCLDAPSSDEALRAVLITDVVTRSRSFRNRLTRRQFVEVEMIAAEIGLPTIPIEDEEDPQDVSWERLHGSIVGLYSLLPRAASRLEERLRKLCETASVKGNSDKVATDALRGLASSADYFIVDTWHAAHAATYAIDSVRPRDSQILPVGRGVSGFLSALESALVD